jgi:hypothetical protein
MCLPGSSGMALSSSVQRVIAAVSAASKKPRAATQPVRA